MAASQYVDPRFRTIAKKAEAQSVDIVPSEITLGPGAKFIKTNKLAKQSSTPTKQETHKTTMQGTTAKTLTGTTTVDHAKTTMGAKAQLAEKAKVVGPAYITVVVPQKIIKATANAPLEPVKDALDGLGGDLSTGHDVVPSARPMSDYYDRTSNVLSGGEMPLSTGTAVRIAPLVPAIASPTAATATGLTKATGTGAELKTAATAGLQTTARSSKKAHSRPKDDESDAPTEKVLRKTTKASSFDLRAHKHVTKKDRSGTAAKPSLAYKLGIGFDSEPRKKMPSPPSPEPYAAPKVVTVPNVVVPPKAIEPTTFSKSTTTSGVKRAKAARQGTGESQTPAATLEPAAVKKNDAIIDTTVVQGEYLQPETANQRQRRRRIAIGVSIGVIILVLILAVVAVILANKASVSMPVESSSTATDGRHTTLKIP